MLQLFKTYNQNKSLFSSSEKILLTVSGGIDSILMCDLFFKAGFNFGIAHCNFQLRGIESELDEAFVKQLAEKYKVPFFSKKFHTSNYAEQEKISIQMAARYLRYEWFEEIRKKNKFKYIATAHHQNDSIETFFINLLRGTGIAGLHGILPKQGNIIRPLLFANKLQIESFVKKNKLLYREDSSNASDKYVRNKIRHHLIPLLKEINPNVESAIVNDIKYLSDVEFIYRNNIENKRLEIVTKKNNSITILIKKIQKLNPLSTYLFEFLKPYNFNFSIVEEIIKVLDGESGKQFFSPTHRLIKDRECLIIESKKETKELGQKKTDEAFLISKKSKKILLDNIQLSFKVESEKFNQQLVTDNNSVCLDFDKLDFPLEVRKWRQGDVFYPLGMTGKKKLSDYFIDKKLSRIQKENVEILISNGKIVWVIGHRMDERFKVTKKTLKIYFVKSVLLP